MSLVTVSMGLFATAAALTAVDTYLMVDNRIKKEPFWFMVILVGVMVLVGSIFLGYAYDSFLTFLVLYICFSVGLIYPL